MASLARVRAGLVLVSTAAVVGAAARAQTPSPPLFTAGTDLVVVHATVTDRGGAYVTGLPRDAFSVFEDGVPQNVSLFASDDAPVTVGLIVDNSGSMAPNRRRVIAAAEAFARSSHPDDEMFVLAFNEHVRAGLPPDAPFTSHRSTLRDALAAALSARGRTALFDATAAGLEYLNRGRHERRVLVLISDGGDNASSRTADDVMRRAQESNALIYTVALIDPLDADSNPALLERLAAATGGRSFMPRDVDQIADVLTRIAQDIRHTYTLGYVSTNSARDGSFRRIRLAVDDPDDNRRLVVRTRPGYLAAAEARSAR